MRIRDFSYVSWAVDAWPLGLDWLLGVTRSHLLIAHVSSRASSPRDLLGCSPVAQLIHLFFFRALCSLLQRASDIGPVRLKKEEDIGPVWDCEHQQRVAYTWTQLGRHLSDFSACNSNFRILCCGRSANARPTRGVRQDYLHVLCLSIATAVPNRTIEVQG